MAGRLPKREVLPLRFGAWPSVRQAAGNANMANSTTKN